jgi:hypothetical protein
VSRSQREALPDETKETDMTHNLKAAHFAGIPAFPVDEDRRKRDGARRLAQRAGADLDGPAEDVADALYDWALEHASWIEQTTDIGVWAEETALLALS